MPTFRFLLAKDDRHFPLGERTDLPDVHAARRVARLAILNVALGASHDYDWTGWRLSIRSGNDDEVDQVPMAERFV